MMGYRGNLEAVSQPDGRSLFMPNIIISAQQDGQT